ncbi:phage scaffolding protein, partial [Paenibacillus chitinolyticus]
MEWLTNVLTEMEISVEQQERIVGTVKENLKGFVPAHRFNEVNEAKKQLLAELEQHKSVDADALTQQIETLKGQLQDTHFKHALQTAANVGNMKCKDLDVLTGLIDKTKIKMNEDGTFE